MIIDFHCHYGKDVDGESSTLNEIISQIKKNDIDKIALFPFNSENLLEESENILSLSKKHKYIIPFLRFDPKSVGKKDLRNALENRYKGIKLHPTSQKFYPDDDRYQWIYDEIAKYKLPILFHSSASFDEPMSNFANILNLAKRYPKQIFVLGHSAGGHPAFFDEITRYENVYVETSVDSYPILYEKVYNKHKFDRFVYGSDFPYSFPHIELEKIRCAKIPDSVKEKILYKNAVEILNV